MDKKHEKYRLPLASAGMLGRISAYTISCLNNAGITMVGQLMDRWDALSLVCKDRAEFKAMLKGFGIKEKQVDEVSDFCAIFSYQLSQEKNSQLLYQKIGGKYVPVECLSMKYDGMSEGIYLVRTSGKKGYVRKMSSLAHLADEVGWFKIAGKPQLDFNMIAKVDYYAEALIDFVTDRQDLWEMSPAKLAQHLAKLMLEVTENERQKRENEDSF